MTTSVLSKPVRSGMRMSFSGLPPVTHAAVTCFSPAAHPADTMPHSAPVSSASRCPTASASSSICTKYLRGRIHRGPDLGPLHGSADDRERAAAIDDRFDADRLVDLRPGLERARRRSASAPPPSIGAASTFPIWNSSRRARSTGIASTFPTWNSSTPRHGLSCSLSVMISPTSPQSMKSVPAPDTCPRSGACGPSARAAPRSCASAAHRESTARRSGSSAESR